MSFPSNIFSKSLRVLTKSWTASKVTPVHDRRSRRISDGKSFKKDKHLSESLAQPLRRNSLIEAWPHTLSMSWSVIPGQKLRSSFLKSRQCWTSKRRVSPVTSLPERNRVDNLLSGLLFSPVPARESESGTRSSFISESVIPMDQLSPRTFNRGQVTVVSAYTVASVVPLR